MKSVEALNFEGDLSVGYRFCLNSRVASRLMVGIAWDEDILSADELYEASLALPWEDFISPDKTFQVSITTVRCKWLKNSQFGALRLKDAIVDRIREKFDDERPSVDTENSDIIFHLHINNDQVKWYVDFSGKSMHKRRYREESTLALMKENLAFRSDHEESLVQNASGRQPYEADRPLLRVRNHSHRSSHDGSRYGSRPDALP